MKRFLPMILAALLVLPLLFVPVLAAASYPLTFETSDTDSSYFAASSIIPDGTYYVNAFMNGSFLAASQEFTLTYDRSGEIFTYFVDLNFGDPEYGGMVVPFMFYYTDDITVTAVRAFVDAAFASTLELTVVPVEGETSVLDGFTSVASAVIDWVGQIAAAIVEHPFLLVTVGIFFVGGCIALFGRLLSRN